jgi:hypothetical protein
MVMKWNLNQQDNRKTAEQGNLNRKTGEQGNLNRRTGKFKTARATPSWFSCSPVKFPCLLPAAT